MRMSQYFLPTLRETPKEAEIVSHRLMLRAGMIQQTGVGMYAWLPLGLRVLDRIGKIIRHYQDESGAQEVLMPTIQPADLWRESGRYDAYGAEMLRIKDRQEREFLYGPTNEEMITDIFRTHIHSYKQIPKNLYHIQWKFRDEIRPRFGVMRGREFLMKDAYSFDLDFEGAQRAYQKMFLAYLRTFHALGVEAYPMRADTGPIGGNLSHEFIILADTGETAVYADSRWKTIDVTGSGIAYDDAPALQEFYQEMTSIYAATDEKHNPKTCPIAPDSLLQARGIEVGHIFYFGTKYSKPMHAVVQNAQGDMVPVEMGSYGIGVSRLVGAIIEAHHDEHGIQWPQGVAPFDLGLINLKIKDTACHTLCEDLYTRLQQAGFSVLYDEREERAGAKFADMDLIGLPWQIIVGPQGAPQKRIEVKNRRTGQRHETSLESLPALLNQKC